MASQLDSFSKFGNWNLPLPIQRRGNFFSDDGFQDYRRYFESAAKDLLQEFDISKNEDTFKTYRRLRDHQLTGTDRATKIAEESDKYKIVMDVEGFSGGDLQVKVSGPNEIMVEGRQEFRNGGGAFSERSFRRRFSLPGLALLEDASSVLSSDNVLTVHIPKKVQEITDQSQQSSTTKQQQQTSQFDTIKSKMQESLQKAQDSVSSFTSDTTQSTSAPSFGNGGANLFDVKIVPRQSFFDDSYFDNVRHNFQKSIDDMMETRRRRVNSIEEDAGIFRKVRETKVENAQAVSVTEDAKEHKIVLDVSGFAETDLKLRAVTESELVVEGKVDKKTSCTSCSHSFKRRFVLPSSVDIRKATSALSSEGILTIIVPKKVESIDYAIPVLTEAATPHVNKDAATHISNVMKKEQEKEDASKTQVDQHLSGESCGASTTTTSTTTTSTTTTKTTTRVSESQNLLSDLEKSVEKEKKLCEMTDKREHVVPINLEEQDSTPKVTSEERRDVTQETHEPSSVLKESQRLLTESTKLIADLESAEKKTPTEYFVPVEVDAGTHVNASTQQTTHVAQQTSHSQKVPSEEDSLQSSVQQHHFATPDTAKSRPSSRIVPISLKGSVYSESVFDDARKSIEKNVQDVFSKYRQSSDVEDRKETTQEDSTSVVKNGQTATTVQEDAHSYEIVIDVYGFEEQELSVKTSGVNEISIEGSSEKTKNGSISKHSFQRTFQLPDCIDLDRASTALSEEGILTVSVPKKNQLLLKIEKVTPISSKISQEVKKSKEVKTTLVIDSSGIVQESKTDRSVASDLSDNTSQISTKTSTTQDTTTAPIVSQISQSTESSDHRREYIVPVSFEEASDVASEAGSVYSTSNLSSQISTVSDTSRDVSQDILSGSTSASSIDTQIQSKAHASDETSGKVIQIQGLEDTGAASTTSTTTSTPAAASSFDDHTRDILSRRGTLFNLPIVSRGHFFDDNIFQDSRSMFESILRNKMNRFSKSSSFVDDLGFFKSLREKKITGGNQMATLSEDDHFNKIVLDVQGFNENNLKVKALSDNEILIEGEVEEKTGSSISRKTFRKHFAFPGKVDLQGATSALSSDGVLNIKIPKKF